MRTTPLLVSYLLTARMKQRQPCTFEPASRLRSSVDVRTCSWRCLPLQFCFPCCRHGLMAISESSAEVHLTRSLAHQFQSVRRPPITQTQTPTSDSDSLHNLLHSASPSRSQLIPSAMLRPLSSVACSVASFSRSAAMAALSSGLQQHVSASVIPGGCGTRTFSSSADDGGDAEKASKHTDKMHYFHFNQYEKPKPKFKSPRKRASKLFHELNIEAVEKSKESNPAIWDVPFRVGDAIEVTSVNQGGTSSTDVEKVRGVVLGRVNRGLASSVILRDVVMGEPIERKIMLHSPLVKSIKVLEENFVYKGKRKVKRAKLYFLRDRKPEETRVTRW